MKHAPTNSRSRHWLIAVFIGLALASGKAATFSEPSNAVLLQLHLGFGLLAGSFAVFRLFIWFKAGSPPAVHPVQSPAVRKLSNTAHGLLRFLPVILFVSGIGMLFISDTVGLILQGVVPPPETMAQIPPRNLHHAAAAVLLALIALHSVAAFMHWLLGFKGPPNQPAK